MRYWIWLNDLVQGPFELEELISLRSFSEDLQVCMEDRQDWLPAGRVADLSSAVEQLKAQRAQPLSLPPPPPTRAPTLTPLQGEFFGEAPGQQPLLESEDEPRGPYAYRPVTGNLESSNFILSGQATMPFHFGHQPQILTSVVAMPREKTKKTILHHQPVMKESSVRNEEPAHDAAAYAQPIVSMKVLQQESAVQEVQPAESPVLPDFTSAYEEIIPSARRLEWLPWIMGIALAIVAAGSMTYWLMDRVNTHSAIAEANRMESPKPISMPISTPFPVPNRVLPVVAVESVRINSEKISPVKHMFFSLVRRTIRTAKTSLRNRGLKPARALAERRGQAQQKYSISEVRRHMGASASRLQEFTVGLRGHVKSLAAQYAVGSSRRSLANSGSQRAAIPVVNTVIVPNVAAPLAKFPGARVKRTSASPSGQEKTQKHKRDSNKMPGIRKPLVRQKATVEDHSPSIASRPTTNPARVVGFNSARDPAPIKAEIPIARTLPGSAAESTKSIAVPFSPVPAAGSVHPSSPFVQIPVPVAQTPIPARDLPVPDPPHVADPWAGRQSEAIHRVLSRTLPKSKITIGEQASTMLQEMHEKELMHAADTGERLFLPDKIGWAALQESNARYRVYLNFMGWQSNGERVQIRSYQFVVDLNEKTVVADDAMSHQEFFSQPSELHFKHNPMATDIESILGGVDRYNKHRVQLMIVKPKRSNREGRQTIQGSLVEAQNKVKRAVIYFRRTYTERALQNIAKAYNFSEMLKG